MFAWIYNIEKLENLHITKKYAFQKISITKQPHCLSMQESIPFAIVGSTQMIEVKGKSVRGRLYPWGVVEVENPEHCDFLKLRTMLMWVFEIKKTV